MTNCFPIWKKNNQKCPYDISLPMENNFQTFILKISDNKIFCGTTEFPYQTHIPLSKEDRNLLIF